MRLSTRFSRQAREDRRSRRVSVSPEGEQGLRFPRPPNHNICSSPAAAGAITFASRTNSDQYTATTGHWYGGAFVDWAWQAVDIIKATRGQTAPIQHARRILLDISMGQGGSPKVAMSVALASSGNAGPQLVKANADATQPQIKLRRATPVQRVSCGTNQSRNEPAACCINHRRSGDRGDDGAAHRAARAALLRISSR
jgi:hypothetical protein